MIALGSSGGFLDEQVVVRYLADGSRDPSFGVNGTATVSTFPGVNSNIHDSSVTSDDRLVFSVWAFGQPTSEVRLDKTGAFDTSFGGDGVIAVATESFYVAPDDSLILYDIEGSVDGLTRVGADGEIDPGFGDGGFVGLGGQEPNIMLVDEPGRVVVGLLLSQSATSYEVLRLNPDGTEDTSFNAVTVPQIADANRFGAIASRYDGRIAAFQSNGVQSWVQYFLSDGSPDPDRPGTVTEDPFGRAVTTRYAAFLESGDIVIYRT